MNHPSYSELASQASTAQPAAGEVAAGSPPGSAAPSGQVLTLHCPRCRHPLNLRREHLGIEGHCVQCGDPLVALEKPGIGVVLEKPGQPPEPALSPPGASPVSQVANHTAPVIQAPSPHEPAPQAPKILDPSSDEPANPQPPLSNPSAWTAPEAAPSPEVSEIEASMAGFTGSAKNQTPESTFAKDSRVTEFPESLPAQDPVSGHETPGEKSPWSPFSDQPEIPPSQNPPNHPQAISTPSPEASAPSPQGGSPFAGGFASFFNQSGSDGDVDTASAAIPPQQKDPDALPWESKTMPVSQMPSPEDPQSLKDQDPLKNGWSAPSKPEAKTGASDPLQTPSEAKSSESKSDSDAEISSPEAPETKKKPKWGKIGKKAEPVGIPGAAKTDLGRRRTLGRPRRGFGRFLLKIVITFVLVVGILGGAYLFTPAEKLESLKAEMIEFLKPGVVLKDYLPVKIPLLEKLAEEAKTDANPPQERVTPAPGVLPSAEIRQGPTPQAAIPVIPKKIKTDRSDEFGPGLASVGQIALEKFYQGQSVEERARKLVDPAGSLPAMRAFYQRYPKLPTLRSIAYRGPVRDAASGRWFGVLDVRENENDEVHRWAITFTQSGKLGIDWGLYQQLRDDSLTRFLTDPAAPPRTMRLLVRRGEPVLPEANPWNNPAVELLLQTPLDHGSPKKIILRRSDFDRLGLATQLPGSRSKIAELELAWTSSDSSPVRQVPMIQKVLRWGAW